MKKNLCIFLMAVLCLLSTSTAQAQTYCTGFTNNTDWRNYVAPPTTPIPPQQQINDFDWSTNFFTTYKDVNGTVTPTSLQSPFWPNTTGGLNQPNVDHFRLDFLNNGGFTNPTQAIENVDLWPEDGWELLYKDFGSPTEAYDFNPSFSLYNKYTGVIRIFYYIESLQTQIGSSTATIGIKNDAARNTANLTFTETELNSLDAFERHLSEALNYAQASAQYWLFTELSVAFDPCVCRYPNDSRLIFDFKIIENGNLIVEGNAFGISFPTIYNSGTYTPDKSNLMFNKTTKHPVTDVIKDANSFYKSLSTFKSNVDKLIDYQDDKSEIDKTKAKSEITLFDIWKTSAKAIPKLGAAIGIIDFLVTGGKSKTTTSKEPRPVAYETELNLKLTGVLQTEENLSSLSIRTPGANSSQTTASPIYNNTLGTFNLLETPPIEYAEYAASFNSVTTTEKYVAGVGFVKDIIADPNNSNNMYNFFSNFKIREYRLAPSPTYNRLVNYIINPQSELVAKQIKGALLFKFTNLPDYITTENYYKHVSGPVEFGITEADRTTYNFVHRMRMLGYEIESWPEGTDKLKDITFRTHYVNLACLENEAIFFTWDYDGANFTDEPEVWLKLDIQLERTDDYAVANPTETQDVMMVLKYKTNIIKNNTSGLIYNANMFLRNSISEPATDRFGYEILPNGDFQSNSSTFKLFDSPHWPHASPSRPYQWNSGTQWGTKKQHEMSIAPWGYNPINKRWGSLIIDNSNNAFFTPPHIGRQIYAYNLYIDPSVTGFTTHHIINIGNQVYHASNWSTITSNVNWQQNLFVAYIGSPGTPFGFFGSTFETVASGDPAVIAQYLSFLDLNDPNITVDVGEALPFITDFITNVSNDGSVLLEDNNSSGVIYIYGYKFCSDPVQNFQATQSEVVSFCTGNDYATLSQAKAGDIDENTPPANPEELSKESLTVYPNPNSGVFASKFTVNGIKQVSLSINDLTGKTIETIIDNKTYITGTYKQNIFLDNIKAGVYICNITIGETVLKEKIVVIK